MNMPLTSYPGAPNVQWGGTGIPAAYPIALNGMGAWVDIVPSGQQVRQTFTGVTKGDPAEILKLIAVGALLWAGYKALTGTARAGERAVGYVARVPHAYMSARAAGKKAKREARKRAWDEVIGGGKKAPKVGPEADV